MRMTRKILSMVLMTVLFLSVPGAVSASGNAEEMTDVDWQEITVRYQAGVLRITGANNMTATIYNITGIPVKSFKVEGHDKRFNVTLSNGLYLVKVGNTTRKILVKN